MTPSIAIAYQGVSGAFSHQAAQMFAESVPELNGNGTFLPCKTFGEMFERVIGGEALYAVVPLENSSIGSIVANYDLLWDSPVTIVKEIILPIHHNLLALPDTRISDIKEIYSHPAALDQCRLFLSQLPNVTAVSYFDTSGAAQLVSERKDPEIAAIASSLAAEQYGLSILKAHVEDNPHNQTRFGVMQRSNGKEEAEKPLPPPYKISCAVELAHQPGSLAALLSSIAALEANLTKIESRPISHTPWQYRFFIDMVLQDEQQDSEIRQLLKDKASKYRFLGRYPLCKISKPKTDWI